MSKPTKNLISNKQKRVLINKEYDLKNKSVFCYKDLNYRNKIYMLAMFRVLTDEDFELILPLNKIQNDMRLSPTSTMDIEILNCLYSKNIILVNPKSKIRAFCFESDKISDEFYWCEVSWIVNISSDEGKRLSLYDCYRVIYDDLLKNTPANGKDLVHNFTYTLAFSEVLQYLQFKCEELGFAYDLKRKTYAIIYQILKNFSVSEIYNFVDQAIEEDYIYYSNTKRDKKYYGESIPIRMIELAENAIFNEIAVSKNKRKESLPRSYISKVFYDLILRGNDEGFIESLDSYWDRKLVTVFN